MLNGEVVLAGVLGAQMWLELTIKKDGPEQRVVDRLPLGGRQNAVKRIRRGRNPGSPRLVDKGSVEESFENRRTAAERRFSTELRHDEFFDGIVEKTPAGANAGLAGVARAPCNPDSG